MSFKSQVSSYKFAEDILKLVTCNLKLLEILR